MERVQGVYGDHKSKVLYPLKPLGWGLGGPPMAFIDAFVVRGNFFEC
jgi:hypothetical protein